MAKTSVSAVRPSLRERKKDATRQAIEDVAWLLFTERGYDATTINDIADQANVAPRTFFRYFPSKEAVLYPELDALLADLTAAFHARPTDEPALQSLVAAMDAISADLRSDRRRQQERFEMMKRAGMSSANGFLHERVATAVADMVRTRYADHPEREVRAQLAAGVMSVVLATSNERWLAGGAKGDPEDEAMHCFDVVRALIGP